MITRLLLLLLCELVICSENASDTNNKVESKETLNFDGFPIEDSFQNPTHKHYHPDGSSEIPLIVPDNVNQINFQTVNQVGKNLTNDKSTSIENINNNVTGSKVKSELLAEKHNSLEALNLNSQRTTQTLGLENQSFVEKFINDVSTNTNLSFSNQHLISNPENVTRFSIENKSNVSSTKLTENSELNPIKLQDSSLTNSTNNVVSDLLSLANSMVNISQLTLGNNSDAANTINETFSKLPMSALSNTPLSLLMQRQGRIIDPSNLTAEEFKNILSYLKSHGLPTDSPAKTTTILTPQSLWKPLSTFSLDGNSASNVPANALSLSENQNSPISEGRANGNANNSVETSIKELEALRNKIKAESNSVQNSSAVNKSPAANPLPINSVNPLVAKPSASNLPLSNIPSLNPLIPSPPTLPNATPINIPPVSLAPSNFPPKSSEINSATNTSTDASKLPLAIKLPAATNANVPNVIPPASSASSLDSSNSISKIQPPPISPLVNRSQNLPTNNLSPVTNSHILQPNSPIMVSISKPQATVITNNISELTKVPEVIAPQQTASLQPIPPAMFLPPRQGENAATLAGAINQAPTSSSNAATNIAQAINSNAPVDATMTANAPSLGTLLTSSGSENSANPNLVSQDDSAVLAALITTTVPDATHSSGVSEVTSGSAASSASLSPPSSPPISPSSPPLSLPQVDDSANVNRETSNAGTSESTIPQIAGVDVLCGSEGMKVTVNFTLPFNGMIYSKDHYQDKECIYVPGKQNQMSYVFEVKMITCGTLSGRTDGASYFQNTLVFQNDVEYIDAFDSSRTIRCDWKGSLNNTLTFRPVAVDILDVQTLVFNGDKVQTKLEILLGSGPFGAPVGPQVINIGDPLSLVISIQSANDVNAIIHDCYAYQSPQSTKPPLLLIDSNGCSVKRKLISSFTTTKIPGTFSSSLIAYATFRAFKFPDALEVYFLCQLTVCRDNCVSPCSQSALGSPPAVPQTNTPPSATAGGLSPSTNAPATGVVPGTPVPGAAAATAAAGNIDTSSGDSSANLASLIAQSGSARSLLDPAGNIQPINNQKPLSGESRELNSDASNAKPLSGINANLKQENSVSVNDFHVLKPHQDSYTENLAKEIRRTFTPQEIQEMIKHLKENGYGRQKRHAIEMYYIIKRLKENGYGKYKRSTDSNLSNRTKISLFKKIKVVAPADFYAFDVPTYKFRNNPHFVCIPKSGFILGTAFLLLLAFTTSLTTLFLCIRHQNYRQMEKQRLN